MTLLRTEAMSTLARHRGDMLSLVTMRAVPIWIAAGQADARNYHVLGSMGSASSIGLGLALARPRERVLVADGDGSLLMQLGTLVSVGSCSPPNLYHVVLQNSVYETSGGQPVPGADTCDMVALARAAGYRRAVRLDSVAEMNDILPELLRAAGPVFIALGITGPGPDPAGAYDSLASRRAEIDAMRNALGVDRNN